MRLSFESHPPPAEDKSVFIWKRIGQATPIAWRKIRGGIRPGSTRPTTPRERADLAPAFGSEREAEVHAHYAKNAAKRGKHAARAQRRALDRAAAGRTPENGRCLSYPLATQAETTEGECGAREIAAP